jgi:hypothetical protein
MKHVRLLMALLAVGILMIPAFSMPDSGNALRDGKQEMDSQYQKPVLDDARWGQQQCDCQNFVQGQDGKEFGPGSMMNDKGQDKGCYNPVMTEAQQPFDCQNPVMGNDGKEFGPKSMMDGKCDKAMMRHDGRESGSRPLFDGECGKARMEHSEKNFGPKSMMEGIRHNQSCQCQKPNIQDEEAR